MTLTLSGIMLYRLCIYFIIESHPPECGFELFLEQLGPPWWPVL